jgi:hypothetical protein
MKKEVILWSGLAILVAVIGLYKLVGGNEENANTINIANKESSSAVVSNSTPTKELERAYARVELFNEGSAENSVEITDYPEGTSATYPAWFKRDNGQGGVVQYTGNEINMKANINGSGTLVIYLKGLQKYAEDNKTLLAIPVTYTTLEINGENVLAEPKTVTYEDYYTYETEVEDKDKVLLNVKWQKPDSK